MRLGLLLVGALLTAGAPLRGQEVPVRADSVRTDSIARPAGVSPRGAFFRSLVLPGWGQAVVGAPARGGVYFALESASLWMLLRTDRRLNDARMQQRLLREGGVLGADARLGLVTAREQQREDWLTLSIFWLFFAGADAYVAAHLRDFNQHVGVRAAPGGGLRIEAVVPTRRNP